MLLANTYKTNSNKDQFKTLSGPYLWPLIRIPKGLLHTIPLHPSTRSPDGPPPAGYPTSSQVIPVWRRVERVWFSDDPISRRPDLPIGFPSPSRSIPLHPNPSQFGVGSDFVATPLFAGLKPMKHRPTKSGKFRDPQYICNLLKNNSLT